MPTFLFKRLLWNEFCKGEGAGTYEALSGVAGVVVVVIFIIIIVLPYLGRLWD